MTKATEGRKREIT